MRSWSACAEPMGLAGQLLVLAAPGIGGGQLVALEFQQGPLATTRLGRLDQLLPLPPQGLVRPARRAIGRQAGSLSPP